MTNCIDGDTVYNENKESISPEWCKPSGSLLNHHSDLQQMQRKDNVLCLVFQEGDYLFCKGYGIHVVMATEVHYHVLGR